MKRILFLCLCFSLWGPAFNLNGEETKTISPLAKMTARSHSLDVRNLLVSSNAISATDYSYAAIVPYITSASNKRTNLGINNYSTSSLTNGTSPTAKVLIMLYGTQGNLVGQQNINVRSNEMYQFNDVITRFGSPSSTAWALIYSDEPFAPWASVISNTTGDPSIEMGVPVPFGKFDAYESGMAFGIEPTLTTRLLVASTTKLGSWQSSLVVTNASTVGGNFLLKLYDNAGQLVSSRTQYIDAGGMYVDDDIRQVASGTFGQIIIEPQTYALTLLASSIVRNQSGVAAFFPAQTLFASSAQSLAAVWQGNIVTDSSGTIASKLTLFQEGAMLYGLINLSGGVFSQPQDIAISGELIDQTIVLDLHHMYDPATGKLVQQSMRFIADIKGSQLVGIGLYVTPTTYEDGRFTFNRTGGAYE